MIEETTRKIRLLYVDPSQFMSLFKDGMKFREDVKLISGVPLDAKLLAVTYDPTVHGILLVVTSDEYEDVPHGRALPMVQVDLRVGKPTAGKSAIER